MKRALVVIPLLFLAGCGFLSRSKSRFYSLERIAPVSARAASSGLPVGIDSLELPPGLDRRDILVRKASGELEVRGTEQWSASLEPLVLHTLAFDLAGRLPEGMVILPGEAKPLGKVRGIDVIVEDLSAGPGSVVTLDVRWVLREKGAPDRTSREEIRIDVPSLESKEIAAGFSRAIATLADRIVAAI
jgi:uncharacterized lipoprotein YmbA